SRTCREHPMSSPCHCMYSDSGDGLRRSPPWQRAFGTVRAGRQSMGSRTIEDRVQVQARPLQPTRGATSSSFSITNDPSSVILSERQRVEGFACSAWLCRAAIADASIIINVNTQLSVIDVLVLGCPDDCPTILLRVLWKLIPINPRQE